jgi:hypothetical protein
MAGGGFSSTSKTADRDDRYIFNDTIKGVKQKSGSVLFFSSGIWDP